MVPIWQNCGYLGLSTLYEPGGPYIGIVQENFGPIWVRNVFVCFLRIFGSRDTSVRVPKDVFSKKNCQKCEVAPLFGAFWLKNEPSFMTFAQRLALLEPSQKCNISDPFSDPFWLALRLVHHIKRLNIKPDVSLDFDGCGQSGTKYK